MLELPVLELNGVFQPQCSKDLGSIFFKHWPEDRAIGHNNSNIDFGHSPYLPVDDSVGDIAIEINLEDCDYAKYTSYGIADAEGEDSAECDLVYTRQLQLPDCGDRQQPDEYVTDNAPNSGGHARRGTVGTFPPSILRFQLSSKGRQRKIALMIVKRRHEMVRIIAAYAYDKPVTRLSWEFGENFISVFEVSGKEYADQKHAD